MKTKNKTAFLFFLLVSSWPVLAPVRAEAACSCQTSAGLLGIGLFGIGVETISPECAAYCAPQSAQKPTTAANNEQSQINSTQQAITTDHKNVTAACASGPNSAACAAATNALVDDLQKLAGQTKGLTQDVAAQDGKAVQTANQAVVPATGKSPTLNQTGADGPYVSLSMRRPVSLFRGGEETDVQQVASPNEPVKPVAPPVNYALKNKSNPAQQKPCDWWDAGCRAKAALAGAQDFSKRLNNAGNALSDGLIVIGSEMEHPVAIHQAAADSLKSTCGTKQDTGCQLWGLALGITTGGVDIIGGTVGMIIQVPAYAMRFQSGNFKLGPNNSAEVDRNKAQADQADAQSLKAAGWGFTAGQIEAQALGFVLTGGVKLVTGAVDAVKAVRILAPRLPDLVAGARELASSGDLLNGGKIVQKLRDISPQIFGDNPAFVTIETDGTKLVRYGPLNRGPLDAQVTDSFRSGSYTGRTLAQPKDLYRMYSDPAKKFGAYWTDIPPGGRLQSTIDSALLPEFGNDATTLVHIRVPAGETIYEGYAAPQQGASSGAKLLGGGRQIVLKNVDPAWEVGAAPSAGTGVEHFKEIMPARILKESMETADHLKNGYQMAAPGEPDPSSEAQVVTSSGSSNLP